ncbi:hypothetical protein K493DRAFT_47659 [Basidiobolus meristosporus CBS 931.73]|uniref:LisH domain-containing protein n=1 Tax=Basidiobolus meristosporus CBS 931.73 TaxID=1314790 RepID=A0A1Y1Y1J5_9FUNG|nr:hypothetical protein K493DRAFT_47659 [Basidiobolus meristosporus CBS 931.73]|eukprot:ORX91883.1 hypothetical protein K493DRAFT_47659 [Basidiobolus meristosporus CBS 931.73]
MGDVEELKQVIKRALEERGALSSVRAKLRSDILTLLDDSCEVKKKEQEELTPLIDQIFIEYLARRDLPHTLSVFLAESGNRSEVSVREQLSTRLGIASSNNRPAIYSIVEKCLEKHP